MTETTSKEALETDYFLASFPRSGNTWVRFLIANLYNTVKRSFDQIDFYNIHNIVPEYQSGDYPFWAEFPGVFKTHKKYIPLFKNSILLLRSPCDTLYSYCDLLNKHKGLSISLEETVLHETYGVRAIVEHADSFIKNCENLLIIMYEKLHHNPGKEMRKICDFLNLNVPADIIKHAVRKSSFRVMEKTEIEKGRKIGNRNFKHIRSGKIGQGKAVIKKKGELYSYVMEELKKSPVLYLLYS